MLGVAAPRDIRRRARRRVQGEVDPIELLEEKLLAQGVADDHEIERVYADARQEVEAAVQQAVREPKPVPADIFKHVYAASAVDVVYPEDYTGLPQ